MDARRLALIARRQRGLFTRADAGRCGYSAYQVRRRLAAGEWRRVVGGVLTTAGTDLTADQVDMAAHLAVPGSTLAGPSAARSWGMAVDDDRTVLLVGPHSSARVPGVRLLYGRLGPREFALVDGARVTLRERTVFDCLRLSADRPGLALLERALQQGWVTLGALGDEIRRHLGQRGVSRVRRLVGLAAGGERSAAERLLTGALRAAGITGWQVNAPIHDERGLVGVGDVVFPARRLVVEADGWAYHSTARAFQLDRTRQNRLVAAGWTVLRFTWRDLTERPDRVVAAVRTVLRGPSGRAVARPGSGPRPGVSAGRRRGAAG